MPDTPQAQPEQTTTDWTKLGAGYLAHVKGSTQTPKDVAITAMFEAEAILLKAHGEDWVEDFFHVAVTDRFTLMSYDCARTSDELAKYYKEKIEPAVTADDKQKNLPLQERAKRIRKLAVALKSPQIRALFEQFLLVGLDDNNNELAHIWSFKDARAAKNATYALANSHVKLDGPLDGSRSTESDDAEQPQQHAGNALHTFFTEASHRNIQLPPMQEDETLKHSGNTYGYVLSAQSKPTSEEYFKAAAQLPRATVLFQQAAKALEAQVARAPAEESLSMLWLNARIRASLTCTLRTSRPHQSTWPCVP